MRAEHARLVLGTNSSATYTDIKNAFRRKAIQLHPDHNHHPNAAAQFARVAEAYRVLMNHQTVFQKYRYANRKAQWFALVRLQ